MNRLCSSIGVVALSFFLTGVGVGQSSGTGQSTTTAQATSSSTANRPKHQHRVHSQRTQVIPRETAPATSPGTAVETPEQRAADQRLLQKQQAQSAQAAAINSQQVKQYQQQQQTVQNEVRIQDAPGPAQTGVVPAAGTPVAPVNADDRIQDAPGPAQTLPKLPATAPATAAPTVPAEIPPVSPPQD